MALLQIAEPGMALAPHERKISIGIDLGTTNSLVAIVKDALPKVLADINGKELFPSVIRYLPDGRTEGGYEALEHVIDDPKNTIVLIGWTTFERTEWFEDGTYHQICGQPWYDVSDNLKARWREYINWSEDKVNYHQLAVDWQNTINDFHLWLKERGFVHRFYHGHHCFDIEEQYKISWPAGLWLEDSPYNHKLSFTRYSESLGFNPDPYMHYDYDAHKEYAELLDKPVKEMIEEIKQNDAA
jgi:hypothetical protein